MKHLQPIAKIKNGGDYVSARWGRGTRTIKQQDPETIMLGDGVNTYLSPFMIKKSEAVDSRNLSSRSYPALAVRPGVTNQFDTTANPFSTVNGAGVRNASTFYINDGTALKYWNGAALVSVITGLTNATSKILEHYDVNGNRNTVFINGTEKKYSTDGTSFSDMTEAPATKLMTVDDNRLYALTGSLLQCSAIYSVTDWTTYQDATSIPIAGMQGAATALTAYNDMVIATSDKTMHILLGDKYANFKFLDPIQCGCVSDRSMIELDGKLYFMDYNKYKMFTGGFPSDISQKVKAYLENIAYTYKDKIVSGAWGRYIYVSIPYGAVSTNNLTLEYDTERDLWYPYDKGYLNFVNIGQDIYGITTAGKAEKMNTGTTDGAGAAISWYHETGVLSALPVSALRTLSNLWVIIDLPAGSTMTVGYSTTVDAADFVTLKTFSTNSAEQRVRVQVPTDKIAKCNYFRLKFAGTGPATVHFADMFETIMPR